MFSSAFSRPPEMPSPAGRAPETNALQLSRRALFLGTAAVGLARLAGDRTTGPVHADGWVLDVNDL